MNTKTIQQLQQRFQDKVCTVFTNTTNRTFDEVHWREHFCVRIQEISVDGIWGVHPYNGTYSFFFLKDIIFIQEEIELDPSNPEHLKMMKEYENKTGEKIISDISPHMTPEIPETTPEPEPESVSAFVDINSLKELARNSKNY